MQFFDDIEIDPKFFAGPTPTQRMCEGCRVRRAEHIHHKEYKGMGGRQGTAKRQSESAENKIALCEVCHRAGHGLRYFGSVTPVYPKGFHCGVCPRRRCCYYGAHLLGLPTDGLERPW